MNLAEQLTALTSLRDSDGWRILKDRMERELLASTMAVARNPNVTSDELRYRQGIAYAVSQLLGLPEALIALVENELRIQQAMSGVKSTQPDTTPKKPRSRQQKSNVNGNSSVS